VTKELQVDSSIDTTGSLPDDMLRGQLLRVQMLYAAGFLLWTITCVFDIYLSPNGDRGPYAPWIDGASALLSAITIGYVRYGQSSDRRKLDLAVDLVVVHAVAIALLNSWAPQPVTSRPISGITLLLLLFGMVAPATPRRILITSLVAASMDPLGVWLAHLRGLPVPSTLHTLAMFHLTSRVRFLPRCRRGCCTGWDANYVRPGRSAAISWSSRSVAAAWVKCGSDAIVCWRATRPSS
jgi:hypothetical protein